MCETITFGVTSFNLKMLARAEELISSDVLAGEIFSGTRASTLAICISMPGFTRSGNPYLVSGRYESQFFKKILVLHVFQENRP